MSITDQIKTLKLAIEDNKVRLVAVSKTKPVEDLMEAYLAGQRVFGENQVQELVDKFDKMPKDVEWHLIGHLQSNKVKYIAPFIHLIHSVDSLKLLTEINKQAEKNARVIDCLLQIYIADEETKYGLGFDEVIELLESQEFQELKNIRIVGLMGIATNTENLKQIREEFYELKTLFDGIKLSYFKNQDSFKEISMGMSSDYEVAIAEGSTLVRIGSDIFGQRVIPHFKNKEESENEN